jgi:hypothetical protein
MAPAYRYSKVIPLSLWDFSVYHEKMVRLGTGKNLAWERECPREASPYLHREASSALRLIQKRAGAHAN